MSNYTSLQNNYKESCNLLVTANWLVGLAPQTGLGQTFIRQGMLVDQLTKLGVKIERISHQKVDVAAQHLSNQPCLKHNFTGR